MRDGWILFSGFKLSVLFTVEAQQKRGRKRVELWGRWVREIRYEPQRGRELLNISAENGVLGSFRSGRDVCKILILL